MGKKFWEALGQVNKSVLMALLLLGIALIVLPSLWRSSDQRKANLTSITTYQEENPIVMTSDIQAQELALSKNAQIILSEIKGVGKLNVWVTLENGAGKEKKNGFNDQVQEQVAGPKVRGVLVTAQGAANSEIRWQLYQAVKALYNIPMDSIYIVEGMEESK